MIRQLSEKDKAMDSVRTEHDKQVANFRAENFDLLKLRQKLELDTRGLKLDLENCRQVQAAESKRAEEEARSLKSRLATAQDALATCRKECLSLAEVTARQTKNSLFWGDGNCMEPLLRFSKLMKSFMNRSLL